MKTSLLVPVLSVTLSLAACSRPEAPQEPVRAVKLMTVKSQTVSAQEGYAGEVRARTESRLGFRVGGKLVQRPAEVGQRVRPDSCWPSWMRRTWRWQPGGAGAGGAAQTQRDLAAADLKRFSDLKAQGFVSGAEIERRQATLDAAEATLRQARPRARCRATRRAMPAAGRRPGRGGGGGGRGGAGGGRRDAGGPVGARRRPRRGDRRAGRPGGAACVSASRPRCACGAGRARRQCHPWPRRCARWPPAPTRHPDLPGQAGAAREMRRCRWVPRPTWCWPVPGADGRCPTALRLPTSAVMQAAGGAARTVRSGCSTRPAARCAAPGGGGGRRRQRADRDRGPAGR
jgi:hypothetical protein